MAKNGDPQSLDAEKVKNYVKMLNLSRFVTRILLFDILSCGGFYGEKGAVKTCRLMGKTMVSCRFFSLDDPNDDEDFTQTVILKPTNVGYESGEMGCK